MLFKLQLLLLALTCWQQAVYGKLVPQASGLHEEGGGGGSKGGVLPKEGFSPCVGASKEKIIVPGTYTKNHHWYNHPKFGSAEYVLVLGIDGYGSYFLTEEFGGGPWELINTPRINSLRQNGAHTYWSRAVMPTVSKPNWMAQISGAGPEETGMLNNPSGNGGCEMEPITGTNTWFPTIFQAIRDQTTDIQSAVYGTWQPFFTNYDNDVPNLSVYHPVGDLFNYTTRFINEVVLTRNFNFMYFYTHDLDGAGHAYNWGSDEYYQEMTNVDTAISRLMGALDIAGIADVTTILLTSDHGGENFSHGPADIIHLPVPFIAHGPGVKQNHLIPCPNLGYSCYQDDVVGYQVRNMDTPSTALFALGLKQPDVWIGRPIEEAFVDT